MRIQMSERGYVDDQMPAALLLSKSFGNKPDFMPARVQMRQAGHVQRDCLSIGDVRILRGEEVVRPVPQGALLFVGHLFGALPRGIFLPARIVGPNTLQSGVLLPLGLRESGAVPGWDFVGTAIRLQIEMRFLQTLVIIM